MASGGLPPRVRRSRPKAEKEPIQKEVTTRPRESARSPYRGGSGASAGGALTIGGVILAVLFIGFKVVRRNDDAKAYIGSFFSAPQPVQVEGANGPPTGNVASVPPSQDVPTLPTPTGTMPANRGPEMSSSAPANVLPTSLPANVTKARSIPPGVASAEYFRSVKVHALPIPNRPPDSHFMNDLQLVVRELVQICQDVTSHPEGTGYHTRICELIAQLHWATRQTYLNEPTGVKGAQEFSQSDEFLPTDAERAALNKFDEVFAQGKISDVYAWSAVNDFNRSIKTYLPMAGAGMSLYQPGDDTPNFMSAHFSRVRDQCQDLAKSMEARDYEESRRLIQKADEDFIQFKIDYLKAMRTSGSIQASKAFQLIEPPLKMYYAYMSSEASELDDNLNSKREMVNVTQDMKNAVSGIFSSTLLNTRTRSDYEEREAKYKALYEEIPALVKTEQRDQMAASRSANRPFEKVEFARTIGTDDRIGQRFAESFAGRVGKENMVWIELTNSRDRFQDKKILEDLLSAAFPDGDSNAIMGSERTSVHAYVKTDQSVEEVIEALDIRFQSETEDRFIVYDLMKKKAKSRRATTKEEEKD